MLMCINGCLTTVYYIQQHSHSETCFLRTTCKNHGLCLDPYIFHQSGRSNHCFRVGDLLSNRSLPEWNVTFLTMHIIYWLYSWILGLVWIDGTWEFFRVFLYPSKENVAFTSQHRASQIQPHLGEFNLVWVSSVAIPNVISWLIQAISVSDFLKSIDNHGVCRWVSHIASSKWWLGCSLWGQSRWTVQHPTFGCRNFIHSGISRSGSHSASSKWRLCHSLRGQYWWTMQHSTFGCRALIHSGVCRWSSLSAFAKWWLCCSLRRQYRWTMQHSTFGWRTLVHSGVRGPLSHSTSPKWWLCYDLRKQATWTMQHSAIGWRTLIHSSVWRLVSHSASSEWWLCCSLRKQPEWTM